MTLTSDMLIDAVNMSYCKQAFPNIYPRIEYYNQGYIEYLKKSGVIDEEGYNKDKSVQFLPMPLLKNY